MKFHILEYCLKTVLGNFLSLLCWSFSMLSCLAIGGFLGRSHKALTPTTPAWLYLFRAHGKAMIMPQEWSVVSIHEAIGNTFFLSAVMSYSGWSCCCDAVPVLQNPCCGCLTLAFVLLSFLHFLPCVYILEFS